MNLNNIESGPISLLEQALAHKFSNIDFLNEALRHSSFVNEHSNFLRDNERLEFLGDAILNFIVSDLIIKNYPELNEGNLSKMRANLVNETQLSKVARSIKLGTHLYLGRGEEQNNGRNKNSILANALEAVLAAVYLDGGMSASFSLVKKLFFKLISVADASMTDIDYKSKLQEKIQTLFHEIPRYFVVGEYGPDHDKIFKVRMSVCNIMSYGDGSSKKSAEQLAAKKGLLLLKKNI